jgi:hypothetical protein
MGALSLQPSNTRCLLFRFFKIIDNYILILYWISPFSCWSLFSEHSGYMLSLVEREPRRRLSARSDLAACLVGGHALCFWMAYHVRLACE